MSVLSQGSLTYYILNLTKYVLSRHYGLDVLICVCPKNASPDSLLDAQPTLKGSPTPSDDAVGGLQDVLGWPDGLQDHRVMARRPSTPLSGARKVFQTARHFPRRSGFWMVVENVWISEPFPNPGIIFIYLNITN